MHKGRAYAADGQVYLLCGHGIGVSTHPGACIERDSKRSLTPSPTSPGAEAAPPTARGTADGHRMRQAAQGAEHPPTAHHAHRGRTEATESQERGDGRGRYLLNKEDPQQGRRRPEKNFEKIEKKC